MASAGICSRVVSISVLPLRKVEEVKVEEVEKSRRTIHRSRGRLNSEQFRSLVALIAVGTVEVCYRLTADS
jgi:hypothetical protein